MATSWHSSLATWVPRAPSSGAVVASVRLLLAGAGVWSLWYFLICPNYHKWEAPSSGTVVAAGAGVWYLWYVALLRAGSHSSQQYGPRWLVEPFADLFANFATYVLRLPLKSNLEEVYAKGTLDAQVFMTWHPHGAFCATATMHAGSFFHRWCTDSRKWFVGVADLLFRFPVIGEFLVTGDCRSASKKTIDSLLADGHCVALQPGGIFEQNKWDPEREVAYFPHKLGWIRMAMAHGVPLVPVYIFGEGQMFGQTRLTRALNNLTFRLFGMGTVFVTGLCGLPWIWPRSVPLYFCVGERVEVGPKDATPSDDKVEDVLRRYCKELRRIFDLHSDQLHPSVASHGLKIVWRGHEDVFL